MSVAFCQLPDAVEALLPAQAQRLELLRRTLLDLYYSWGYELVIPPLLEFTEALLVPLDSDIDLHTFKVIDQLSGRTLGIRADMTPQVARIDAHSFTHCTPARLCYAGSVLHTKPKTLLASRESIQLGAELFGDASLNGDVEIISLMLETVRCAGIKDMTLDLGHVGLYRTLLQQAALNATDEQILFDALQRKAQADIEAIVTQSITDASLAQMMVTLSQLSGDYAVIEQARRALAKAPAAIHEALDSLEHVAHIIHSRLPEVAIYFDLSELRGYRYHSGLVFAALAPGYGQALANGGRYDDMGNLFGRVRPATGFNGDLKALLACGHTNNNDSKAILAPTDAADTKLWRAIQSLRQQGERVIGGSLEQGSVRLCDRQLVYQHNEWRVTPLGDH